MKVCNKFNEFVLPQTIYPLKSQFFQLETLRCFPFQTSAVDILPTFKSSSCAILPFLYHKTTLLNSRVLSPSSLSYVRMSHVIYILQRNNVQTKARAYIKEHFILFWPRYKINIASKKFIMEIKISTLLRLRGNGMYFFCLKNVQGIKFKFIMETNHNLKRQVSVHNAASSWIFL